MKLHEIVQSVIDVYELAAPDEPQGFIDLTPREKLTCTPKRPKNSQADSDNNGEGSGSGNTRAKYKSRAFADDTIDKEEDEDPDKSRMKKAKRKRLAAIEAANGEQNASAAVGGPGLREGMKVRGRAQSQGTDDRPAESAGGMEDTFESLKTGTSRKSRGRLRVTPKPIAKILSSYRVTNSDDEDEPALTQPSLFEEKEAFPSPIDEQDENEDADKARANRNLF
jgi:hypothetical protein